MSEQLDKKSILEMSMGAILERVDYEMGKVLDNILDPNTKATGKRKITVGLELVPSADRRPSRCIPPRKATWSRRSLSPPACSSPISRGPAKWWWQKWYPRSPDSWEWTAGSRTVPRSSSSPDRRKAIHRKEFLPC